jgi:hypothetical protein
MIYKLLTEKNGEKIYARIDDDGLCRLTCAEDDQAYLAWVAEGGEVLPADSLPAEETK